MNRQVFNALAGVAPILAPSVSFLPRGMPDYMTEGNYGATLDRKSRARRRSRNTHRGKRGKKVSW